MKVVVCCFTRFRLSLHEPHLYGSTSLPRLYYTPAYIFFTKPQGRFPHSGSSRRFLYQIRSFSKHIPSDSGRMSGRERGRGGVGGRGRASRGGGGRGTEPGAGPGGGRGRGVNVPSSLPVSSSTVASTPAQPIVVLSEDLEKKLNLSPSSSTQVSASERVERDPAAPEPPALQQLPPESSKALRLPARPGFGTIGQKVMVTANHFLVKIADRDLTHYDVLITPEVVSKKQCRLIMSQLVSSYSASHLGKRKFAYDGRKSAYAAGPLPFSSKDFVVKLVEDDKSDRREREYKVSIRFAATADLHHLRQFLQGGQLDIPQETLQCLDVVLRENPSNRHSVVGRSFFSTELGVKGQLGDGLEYWKGFYQSLRPTQMGLSLNIDMSARAFFETIYLTEYVAKFLNRNPTRPLSDQDRVKVKRSLKGVRVEVNHQKHIKRYKISGISTEPMQQLMFSVDDTRTKTSVVQYFREKYNIVLQYPFLPAVQAGSDSKPVYLPMELCKIVGGQRYTKRLNERQVSELLKANCQRPEQRENDIIKMVQRNNYNVDDLVKEFGIQVQPALTSVEARVLPAPMLRYHETGRDSRVQPRVGQWNMIDKKMVNGGRVESWTCINFSRNIDSNRFCHELIDMCCSKGMEFNPNPLVPFRSANSAQIEKALCDIHAESSSKLAGKHLQLLIVILPDGITNYGKIKRICETELGIVSQCCHPKKAGRYSPQYMENVSLKINVKVGGRNTVLDLASARRIPLLSDRPTIVFGADVTHPPPGEDSSPSIAAVVASMDWPEVTKYRGLVSAQSHREEIIQDLYKVKQDPTKGTVHGGLIREHLIAFYKSTGSKPHRIIFYRDGVSEGQFNQVLLHEMDAIRKACVSLEETYLPRITFVVVQKRHHTRLFASNHKDRSTTDKSGNILPGTVVDTKICHPTQFDFYLCSHAGIQGTSRPAHYHVLFDENNFTADYLQSLTNNLCYTYVRCTRSVSIVPPAYYAHLAAFRARYYVENNDMSDSGSTIEGGPGATRERNLAVRALPTIKDNVKEVMFYC